MGEAKRRRLLDPNYGTTQLPDEFAQIFDDFVNKQTDIAIISKQCRPMSPTHITYFVFEKLKSKG